jgi:hypothetical protein
VLAERRWWHAHTRLRFRVLHGRVDKLHWPTTWVVHLYDHVSCANCWGSVCMIVPLVSVQKHTVLVVECILYIVDGGVGYHGQLKVNSQHDRYHIRMPQPSRTSSHSCVVFCFVSFSISSSKVSRFCTLMAFVLKRSSLIHSGFPMRLQRTPYRRSLPPPRRMSPSDVLKALYGTIDASIC